MKSLFPSIKKFCLALSLLCSLAALSMAQSQTIVQVPESGSVRGSVADSTGASVVNGRVLLTDSSGKDFEVATDADGQFSFANVAPGDYRLNISATGFASRIVAGTLEAGKFVVIPVISLSPAPANTSVQVTASTYEIAEAQIKMQEQQRVVGFFPNFYVSYVPDAAPLSKKQKFELSWRSLIDPATIIVTGVTAGIEQAQNGYSDYGQGAQGYAKRFGASYADIVTDSLIGEAILPSLLKQDPRYFYKGTGSKRSRLFYAVANTVITRSDKKHWQPNYSGILGGLASGGISNLYYPEKDRGWSLTFTNLAVGMGSAAAVNVLQEFVIKRFTPKAPKSDRATNASHP